MTGQTPHCSISTSAVMSSPQGQSVPDLPLGLTIHQSSCNSGLFSEDGWGLRTGALECCGPSRCLHVTPLLQSVDQVSEGNDPCDPCSWRRDSWNGNGEALLAPPWVVATCKFIWSEERSPFICGETDKNLGLEDSSFPTKTTHSDDMATPLSADRWSGMGDTVLPSHGHPCPSHLG